MSMIIQMWEDLENVNNEAIKLTFSARGDGNSFSELVNFRFISSSCSFDRSWSCSGCAPIFSKSASTIVKRSTSASGLFWWASTSLFRSCQLKYSVATTSVVGSWRVIVNAVSYYGDSPNLFRMFNIFGIRKGDQLWFIAIRFEICMQ